MEEFKKIFEWLSLAGIVYEDSDKQRQLGLDLIDEELSELYSGIMNGNKEEIKDGAVDLIWMILNNIVFNNITQEEFFDFLIKVRVSNFSKFCTDEETAIKTVEAYKTGTHPDKIGQEISCYYTKIDNYFIIKRFDDKVMKSIHYKKVSEI